MAERTQPVDTGHTQPTVTDATTARVDIPAAEFALSGLFERVPDARVEVEPAVAGPADHALLGIEADGHGHAVLANTLEADPAIAAVEHVGEREAGWAYRVAWAGRARRLLHGAADSEITIVAAWARDARWCFRLLAPDRAALSRAHDAIKGLGYRPECKRIASSDGQPTPESGLTDQQREAVIAAFEAGYYDIPRDVSAEDLAETLGISHQALSERFRRAHHHLVGSTLRIED